MQNPAADDDGYPARLCNVRNDYDGIKSHPASTGYDYTSLTHRSPFRILNNYKSRFFAKTIIEHQERES